jgi:putative intracellular protease/amidase
MAEGKIVIIEDRELITGQNPRSDKPIAARLIAVLERAAVAV